MILPLCVPNHLGHIKLRRDCQGDQVIHHRDSPTWQTGWSSTVRLFDQQVAWGLDEAAASRCTQETRVDDVQQTESVSPTIRERKPNTGRTINVMHK